MKTTTLTKDDSIREFKVHGECYICIEGSGTAQIQRDIGNGYRALTDSNGKKLNYPANGTVMFNGTLTSNKKLPYRVVVETESEVAVTIANEDK